MPAGERADRRVTWNHIFFTHRLVAPPISQYNSIKLFRNLGFRFFVHPRFRLPPGILFFARPEAREIATAGSAAIRRRAQLKQQADPAARAIVLRAPGGQVLTIAAWASRELPGPGGPCAGLPARAASPAPQGVDPQQSFDVFSEIPVLRNTNVARSTLGACELHRGPFDKL